MKLKFKVVSPGLISVKNENNDYLCLLGKCGEQTLTIRPGSYMLIPINVKEDKVSATMRSISIGPYKELKAELIEKLKDL